MYKLHYTGNLKPSRSIYGNLCKTYKNRIGSPLKVLNNYMVVNCLLWVKGLALVDLKFGFYAKFHCWGQFPRSGILNPGKNKNALHMGASVNTSTLGATPDKGSTHWKSLRVTLNL